MVLWFLALKARKAGNRPRTFYTGLTVCDVCCLVSGLYFLLLKKSHFNFFYKLYENNLYKKLFLYYIGYSYKKYINTVSIIVYHVRAVFRFLL